MALPTLTRTWQFQVNNAIGPLGTAALTNAAVLFAIKNALIGGGAWTDSAGAGTAATSNWTVVRSSNSAVADGNDNWAAAANVVWGSGAGVRSWIILRQTGIATNYELLLDCNAGIGSESALTVRVSPSIGFTGGTTTTSPTSPADVITLASVAAYGVSAANAVSTLHVLKTADGTAARIAICRGGFATGYWLLEKPGEPVAGWTNPSISCLVATAGAAATQPLISTLSTTAVTWGFSSNAFTNRMTGIGTRAVNGMIAVLQLVPTDIPASFPIMKQGIYSFIPNARGRNGIIVDQWWTMVTTVVDSDTFPAGGTMEFVVLGDVVWPWNQTAPAFGGGASTARAGDLIPESSDWFSSHLPAQAPTADSVTAATSVVVYYIMQANDSVTGVRYDWTVPSAPDWAAVGYPGPNAATNVAIAGMLQ